jgi:hypothetical protein
LRSRPKTAAAESAEKKKIPVPVVLRLVEQNGSEDAPVPQIGLAKPPTKAETRKAKSEAAKAELKKPRRLRLTRRKRNAAKKQLTEDEQRKKAKEAASAA